MSLRTILSILFLPLLSKSTALAVESTDFLPAGMLLNRVRDSLRHAKQRKRAYPTGKFELHRNRAYQW